MYIHDDLYKKINVECPLLYDLWEPDETTIVLGYSQKAENEVNLQACFEDNIQVLKRRGGGGAVVLMPGVLCITTAFLSEQSISPYYFFKKINLFLIDVLQKIFGIDHLDYRGISDIAIKDRKILGCSIFKSRVLFFYQGSLLVNPDLTAINRYLLHPSKEPDYRGGRHHDDFVTCLHKEGYQLSLRDIKTVLQREMNRHFADLIL